MTLDFSSFNSNEIPKPEKKFQEIDGLQGNKRDGLLNLLFTHKNPELKKAVIQKLGQTKPDREVLHSLEQVLFWDNDVKIKIESVQTLGKLGTVLSVFNLEKAYLSELDPEVRKNIVWVLPKIQKDEALDFLQKQLREEKNEQVIQEIIFTLSEIADVKHFEEFIKDFSKYSFKIQRVIVWSLARIKNEKAKLILVHLLKNRELSDEILLEIIHICGKYNIKKSVPILIKILREKNHQLKKHTIWVLSGFDDKKIIPIFARRFKREKMPDVRDELKKAIHYLRIFL